MIRPGFIAVPDAPRTTALFGSRRFFTFLRGRFGSVAVDRPIRPFPSTAIQRPSAARRSGFTSSSSSVKGSAAPACAASPNAVATAPSASSRSAVAARSRGGVAWRRLGRKRSATAGRVLDRPLEPLADPSGLKNDGRRPGAQVAEPLCQDAPEAEDQNRAEGRVLLEGEKRFRSRRAARRLHLLDDEDPRAGCVRHPPAHFVPDPARRGADGCRLGGRYGDAPDVGLVEDLRRDDLEDDFAGSLLEEPRHLARYGSLPVPPARTRSAGRRTPRPQGPRRPRARGGRFDRPSGLAPARLAPSRSSRRIPRATKVTCRPTPWRQLSTRGSRTSARSSRWRRR